MNAVRHNCMVLENIYTPTDGFSLDPPPPLPPLQKLQFGFTLSIKNFSLRDPPPPNPLVIYGYFLELHVNLAM